MLPVAFFQRIYASPWWEAFLFCLVNFICRGWMVPQPCLSGDELFTVYFAQWDLNDSIPLLFQHNNIPPTFEFFLHGWIKCFGIDSETMRLLPVLFTSLTAMAVYLIGRKIGTSVAYYASALFLLSGFQMEWALLLRAYSLSMMAITWSCYFLLRWHDPSHENNTSAKVGWALTSALAIASHYLTVFVLIAQFIWCIVRITRKEQLLKNYFKPVLLLFACVSPFVYFLVMRILDTHDQGSYVPPVAGASDMYRLFFEFVDQRKWLFYCFLFLFTFAQLFTTLHSSASKRTKVLQSVSTLMIAIVASLYAGWFPHYTPPASIDQLCALIVSVAISCLIIIAIKSHDRDRTNELLIWWFGFLFVLLFWISYFMPVFINRYISMITPALFIGISVLAHRIKFYPYQLAALGIPIVMFFASTYSIERASRPDELMSVLKEKKKTTDIVVWTPGYADLIWAYYYNHSLFTNVAAHAADTLGEKIVKEIGYTRYKEGLRRALRAEGIYVANDSTMLPSHLNDLESLLIVDADVNSIYPSNGIFEKTERSFGPPHSIHFTEPKIGIYSYSRSH